MGVPSPPSLPSSTAPCRWTQQTWKQLLKMKGPQDNESGYLNHHLEESHLPLGASILDLTLGINILPLYLSHHTFLFFFVTAISVTLTIHIYEIDFKKSFLFSPFYSSGGVCNGQGHPLEFNPLECKGPWVRKWLQLSLVSGYRGGGALSVTASFLPTPHPQYHFGFEEGLVHISTGGEHIINWALLEEDRRQNKHLACLSHTPLTKIGMNMFGNIKGSVIS